VVQLFTPCTPILKCNCSLPSSDPRGNASMPPDPGPGCPTRSRLSGCCKKRKPTYPFHN
jgi:hypothetical protein